MRKLAVALALALVAAAVPAAAAPITITKTAAPVSDGVNTLAPKVLPGGVIEYTLVATNPALNPSTIGNVVVCDVLSGDMVLLTADLSPGAGPVAFSQGLVTSGLAYSYASLVSTTDGLAFFGANDVALVPTAAADARVRKVCVTLTGAPMVSGGSFRLRYRVRVR